MFYDVFVELSRQRNIKPSRAADEMKINRSTVTNWKKNGSIPNTEIMKKIADYFGVTTDYLLDVSYRSRNYPSKMEVFDRETGKLVATYKDGKKESAPTLTAKDERDIEKSLVQTLSALEEGQTGLMFDGEPLDEITRDLLAASLRNSMEMAKKLAKEKYGRKKED